MRTHPFTHAQPNIKTGDLGVQGRAGEGVGPADAALRADAHGPPVRTLFLPATLWSGCLLLVACLLWTHTGWKKRIASPASHRLTPSTDRIYTHDKRRTNSSEVWSLALSPQGDRLLTGAADRQLRMWAIDSTSQEEEGVIATYMGSVLREAGAERCLNVVWGGNGAAGGLVAAQGAGKGVDVFRVRSAAEAKRKMKRRMKVDGWMVGLIVGRRGHSKIALALIGRACGRGHMCVIVVCRLPLIYRCWCGHATQRAREKGNKRAKVSEEGRKEEGEEEEHGSAWGVAMDPNAQKGKKGGAAQEEAEGEAEEDAGEREGGFGGVVWCAIGLLRCDCARIVAIWPRIHQHLQ